MQSIPQFAGSLPFPLWLRRLPRFLGSPRASQRFRTLVGPPPKSREIQVACYSAILIAALLWVACARPAGFLGWHAGQDFAAFYNAGTILNRGMADQLYDLNLQTSLYRALFPTESVTSLFPNAPWFALIFRPFALLPFSSAYVAWVALSIALYLGGIALLWPAAMSPITRRCALLAAASFHPFVLETLISGQVTAIAFFLVAAATRLLRDDRCFAAGCLLAGCLYKPTTLILILPMLVIARQWNVLVGMAAGANALVTISILFVSPSSPASYWRMMREYRTMTSSHQDAFLAWEKFTDGYHFFRLLPGGDSVAMMIVAAAIAALLLYLLVPAWVAAGSAHPGSLPAVWAATITFTLILNLHAQHYDAVFLVVALLVLADLVSRQPAPWGMELDALRSAFFRVSTVLWALPWVSQTITRQSHVQVYSLAILAMGLLQLAAIPALHQRTKTIATSSA